MDSKKNPGCRCIDRNANQVHHAAENETLDLVAMKEKAYELCKKFIGGAWKEISPSDMIFRRIRFVDRSMGDWSNRLCSFLATMFTCSGGLTNLLYYCGLPTSWQPIAGEPNDLLLRLYGKIHEDGTGDAVVKESVIFMLLSERRLGPKLYGVFSGGRLEEYIPVSFIKLPLILTERERMLLLTFSSAFNTISQQDIVNILTNDFNHRKQFASFK